MNFQFELRKRLKGYIISEDALFDWMIKYKFNLRGSLILQILLNVDWVDSDIDFHSQDLNLVQIGTSREILQEVFLGDISYESRVLSSCEDGRNSGPCSRSAVLIGNKVEISWNFCWESLQSYEFLDNSWNPYSGLIMRTNIFQKFGNCDIYSELLARVRFGQSALHALSRILYRIDKYKLRGFTITI
jgi:hypothetical protein